MTTERATDQTFYGSNHYRYLRKPAHPGQLRLKAWRYLVPPTGANDPQWLTQAASYWQLQAETYGLKFHDDMTLMIDYQRGLVITSIHVERILPGQRDRHYVVPRAAA